ncbi:sulfotransferase domain-containing protein [Shewanella abyssi]|uniref:sulfotransferase domain-containing protein n=1 Tax=Shewanella abyssi TaxID=311789 RepID=UPI00200F8EB2|nr:sulfotransferase domain-containing protein [Shewanella abyssi]MCL1049561.1 sulfotransferase domain-containing protein [Shewanella abyssi]
MSPDFIIVGAPKAGTTSLYHYLSANPSVFMTEPKEINFFSCEALEKQNLFYADFKVNSAPAYQALFSKGDEVQVKGEASVSYLFYPDVAKSIYEYNPECKIIMVLRDPIARGYSHYLMDLKLGLVDLPYEDIVFKKGNHKNMGLYYQQYVELGLYGKQVKRYLDVFPREQIKIYTQEELKADTPSVVNDLFGFLDVQKASHADTNVSHNQFSMPRNKVVAWLYSRVWLRKLLSAIFPYKVRTFINTYLFKKGRKPVMTESVKSRLAEIYREDMLLLNELIEQDVSSWSNSNA